MALDTRERIRDFIRLQLAERDDRAGFADGDSLIKSGRLDSLAVVRIVTFLEADFAVDFARIEFDPERFDTVDEIAAMVAEAGQA